jgi:adenylate cyclase
MPNDQKITRKLTAIMSADVKGYSLLMSEDEIHTIQTLKTHRQIMSEYIQQHTGRVVDSPGDNLLAEFGSAVDAVQCAVKIQKRLKKENDRFVEDKRLEFRIGVNVGDVVQDENNIYGSGVNVAARIEGLADSGGVCISRNAYDHVKDKLDLGFEFLGEHKVKNIKDPLRVYKVLLDSDSSEPIFKEPLELTDMPSIAVLPFENMSGDPSQEYFSDGLTDQIINGLCKVANLFVIARNSSFAYKGKSISIKQIANELGVQYILEGSVQKAGDRVRITAQLIDAKTDYHKWSESYDRELTDIFDLQDEITMNILWAMNANVTHGEQAQIWSQGMKVGLKAYDAFMRGLEQFYRFNKEDNDQAKTNYQRSLDIEPSAIVYAMLGFAHLVDLMYGWCDSQMESFDKANKCAEAAHEMNEDVDILHMLLGYIYLYKGMHDKAVSEGKRAIQLSPNGAEAHVHLAAISNYAGNSNEAIRLIKKAFRLNPTPTSYYYNHLGTAYRSLQKYEDAITACESMIHMNPNSLPPYINLASCHSLLNQLDKARQAVTDILRIDPQYSIGQFALTMPFKDKEELELYLEALRKAGLPE